MVTIFLRLLSLSSFILTSSVNANLYSHTKLYSCDAIFKGTRSFQFQFLKTEEGKYVVSSAARAIDNDLNGEGVIGLYEMAYKKIKIVRNDKVEMYDHFSSITPLFLHAEPALAIPLDLVLASKPDERNIHLGRLGGKMSVYCCSGEFELVREVRDSYCR